MKTQLKLGEFIFLLERLDPKMEVQYDFHRLNPTAFDSYQGTYSELALGVSFQSGDPVKAGDLLKLAKECIGKPFDGWKGGEYVMHERTPLWTSNRGDWSQTAIVGITDWGIIETAHIV